VTEKKVGNLYGYSVHMTAICHGAASARRVTFGKHWHTVNLKLSLG